MDAVRRGTRCMVGRTVLAGALVVTGVALFTQPAAARDPSPPQTVNGAWLAAELAAGRAFDGRGTRVVGDVDLRAASTVTAPFKCVSCTIQGSLVGTGATFRSLVDLTETQVTQRVSLEGVSFARGLVWSRGSVKGDVLLGLAVFSGTAFFDAWTVAGTASLTGASFADAAYFTDADFFGDADFTGATFGSLASFSGQPATEPRQRHAPPCERPDVALRDTLGVFGGRALFSNARFQDRVIFRGRCFVGDLMIVGATGNGLVDLTGAQFGGAASFTGSIFTDDVSFASTSFGGNADLQHMKVGGNLSFEAADFGRDGLTLDNSTIKGDLALSHLETSGPLLLSGVSCTDLILKVDKIDRVSGPATQIEVLQHIERTARARGDPATANDARYEWLLRSGQRAGVARPRWYPFFDHFLYREVAGYLARPWHPIRAFLLLLLVGAGVRATAPLVLAAARRLGRTTKRRWRHRRRAGEHTAGNRRPGVGADRPLRWPSRSAAWSALGRGLGRLGQSLAATMSAAFRGRPAKLEPEPQAIGRTVLHSIHMGEYLLFKALLVVVVLCLANANETLHQLIQALFSA